MLALGNLYYNAKFEKKEKEERYLKLALEFYLKVLQRDPKNIFAANGMCMSAWAILCVLCAVMCECFYHFYYYFLFCLYLCE